MLSKNQKKNPDEEIRRNSFFVQCSWAKLGRKYYISKLSTKISLKDYFFIFSTTKFFALRLRSSEAPLPWMVDSWGAMRLGWSTVFSWS